VNAPRSRDPGVAALDATVSLLASAAARLAHVAALYDRWLEARRRAAADLAALAAMSDRELADFGVDRGSVRAVATGAWQRER
jgi:uncharacterized protein YjiS (DUF1127 family)